MKKGVLASLLALTLPVLPGGAWGKGKGRGHSHHHAHHSGARRLLTAMDSAREACRTPAGTGTAATGVGVWPLAASR